LTIIDAKTARICATKIFFHVDISFLVDKNSVLFKTWGYLDLLTVEIQRNRCLLRIHQVRVVRFARKIRAEVRTTDRLQHQSVSVGRS